MVVLERFNGNSTFTEYVSAYSEEEAEKKASDKMPGWSVQCVKVP